MAICTYLSIITLNVYGLNATIKRQRVIEWIKNKAQVEETYLTPKDTCRMKVKGWKNINHANRRKLG